jgi:hypothetical protein
LVDGRRAGSSGGAAFDDDDFEDDDGFDFDDDGFEDDGFEDAALSVDGFCCFHFFSWSSSVPIDDVGP